MGGAQATRPSPSPNPNPNPDPDPNPKPKPKPKPNPKQVGGCMSWGEACLFTGGFAHYQFYAQSVGFQVAKIKTHLDAGDRKNAKVQRWIAP